MKQVLIRAGGVVVEDVPAPVSGPGSIGVVEEGMIPYQAWARAQQKDNKEHWLDRDPEVKCFLAGIPRSMYMPYPFAIVQVRYVVLARTRG